VDDGRASRRHCTLTVEKNAVALADESKHGTFVDGKRISKGTLVDGSALRVGDTVFVLRREPMEIDDARVDEVVGASLEACILRSTLTQVGDAKATVLLLGETGTGKEVAARALHRASGRRGAFVPVNCSAIPASLFESELFGHVKGAFTGADKDDEGLVRAATGGTLFLDEIGELPLEVQAKLLRFLDEGAVLGVGARKPVNVDVRVVAATHQDLARAVSAGKFRADLYARLAEIVVPLPKLVERRDDVLMLLDRALDMASGGSHAPLHADLAWALVTHSWPFNVREVVKVASELAVKGRGKPVLELDLVSARLANPRPAVVVGDERQTNAATTTSSDDDDAPDDAAADSAPAPDRAALEQLLREHKGVLADIARVTKRSRRQVRRWVERFGLNADDYRGKS
jgi:DNA-binding NtrC family response regulator